jgi:hypothetical protein
MEADGVELLLPQHAFVDTRMLTAANVTHSVEHADDFIFGTHLTPLSFRQGFSRLGPQLDYEIFAIFRDIAMRRDWR